MEGSCACFMLCNRAGGREDADVRMMGEGRPFVLELINPQRTTPSTEELSHVERTLAQADQ